MNFSRAGAFVVGLLWLVAIASGANIPTITVTRQATVRFPEDNLEPQNSTKKENLIKTQPPTSVAPVNLTTLQPSKIEATTLRPSKIEAIAPVKISKIGATTLKPLKIEATSEASGTITIQPSKSVPTPNSEKPNTSTSIEDEIVVKASDLLELLDFLRELPRERFVEIYPQVLSKNDPQSSTESFAEKLNKLRQHEVVISSTTTSATISTSTSTTTSTTSDTSPTSEDTNDNKIYDELTTLSSIEADDEDEINITEQSPVTNSQTKSTSIRISVTEDLVPPLLNHGGREDGSTTTPKYYEFTDYPPPLPPSLSQPPLVESEDDRRGRDASFAVGVAVGILACVVVAAACVTWCICRKHWGRRNVYATMEVEEIPKAFTKPGPPVILPNELFKSVLHPTESPSSLQELPDNPVITEL